MDLSTKLEPVNAGILLQNCDHALNKHAANHFIRDCIGGLDSENSSYPNAFINQSLSDATLNDTVGSGVLPRNHKVTDTAMCEDQIYGRNETNFVGKRNSFVNVRDTNEESLASISYSVEVNCINGKSLEPGTLDTSGASACYDVEVEPPTQDARRRVCLKKRRCKYTCRYCSGRFSWQKHLDLHVMLKHTFQYAENQCDKCSRFFVSDANLSRHKIIKHSLMTFLHKCTDCHELFISRGHFNRHKTPSHVGCHNLYAQFSADFVDDVDTSDYDVFDYGYKAEETPEVKKPLSKLRITLSKKNRVSVNSSDSDGSYEFSISNKRKKVGGKPEGKNNTKRKIRKREDDSDSEFSPEKKRKYKKVKENKSVVTTQQKKRGRKKKEHAVPQVKIKEEKESGNEGEHVDVANDDDAGLMVKVNPEKDKNYQLWAENELARWRSFKVETIFAKLTCAVCGKEFKRRNHMKRHLFKVHLLEGDELDAAVNSGTKFNCPGCGEVFVNRAALKHHLCNTCTVIGDTDMTSSYIECKHCKQNVEKYRIKLHLESCGKFYECVYCDITFNTYKDYNQHRLSEHIDKTTFPCRFCGMIFKKFYHMNRHVNIHLKVKPVACKECSMKFTQEHAYKEHMVTEHNYQQEDLVGLTFGYLPLKSRHYERQFTIVKKEERNLDESGSLENNVDDNSDNDDNKSLDLGDNRIFRKLLKEGTLKQKRKFPCPTCGKILSQKSHLSRHMTVHGAIKNHLCQECGKRFATKYHLSRHMVSHSGIREHQCMHCGKMFMKKESLNSHMIIHSERDKYACDYCSKSYFDKKSLDLHMQKRHVNPVQKKQIPCEICREIFADRICLRKHKNRMHNDELLQCKECNRGFPDKASLKTHIVKEHGSSSAVFQCAACQKIFLTQRDYSRHLTTHNEVRQHECPECGRMFKRPSHVLAHMTMHSGDKPHQCVHCGKVFRRTDYLYGHLKRDHGELNPHKCHVCSFSCSHINRLKKHLAHSHDIVYDSRCDVCNVTFTNRERLAEHMSKVHDDKSVATTTNQSDITAPAPEFNIHVPSSNGQNIPMPPLIQCLVPEQETQHVPQTVHSSHVPQTLHSAHLPQTLHSAHIPQTVHSAHVPQTLHSAHVPHTVHSAHVPQTLHSAQLPQTVHSAHVPHTVHNPTQVQNHPQIATLSQNLTQMQNSVLIPSPHPSNLNSRLNPLPAHNPTPAHNAVRHMAPFLPAAMAFNSPQFWTSSPYPPHPHPHMYPNM